jgi:hypothetical protein
MTTGKRDSGKEVALVTVVVGKELSAPLIDALKESGLMYINTSPGRRIFLREEAGIMRLFAKKQSLFEDQIVIISFLISQENEQSVIDFLIQKGSLDVPGRGCIFSRVVELLAHHDTCPENTAACPEVVHRALLTDLLGITCVVHLGKGNTIGRVALDTGTGIPAITYGIGTGVRDKMGLWRITVPAEKEIVNFVVNKHDAGHLMDIMIDVGSLDEPGRGFLYLSPVKMGLLNTKYHIGMKSHVASIEQVVAVIDEIKGGTNWRRSDFSLLSGTGRKKMYIENLINLTLICNEERTRKLVSVAMSAGAKGASSSKCRHVYLNGEQSQKISPNRETSEFIVFESQIPDIYDALSREGAFDDTTHGQLYKSPVLKSMSSELLKKIFSR